MSTYTLVYHAGIPGRGEFIRLYLEATGTPYTDTALEIGQSAITPYLDGTFEGNGTNPPPFAPPILVTKAANGKVESVISQTSNIISYLSSRVGPIEVDDTEESDGTSKEPLSKKTKSSSASLDDVEHFHRQQMLLTVLDMTNEAHDTHHPICVSMYYEDQKDEAVKKAKQFRDVRIARFFKNFENAINKSGGEYLLMSGISYADLALFQLIDGLKFSFPKQMDKTKFEYPKVMALYEKVKTLPRIKSYLESKRRQPYSGGVFRHYDELDLESA